MSKRPSGKPGSIYPNKTAKKGYIGKIRDGVRRDGTMKYKLVYGKTKKEVDEKLLAYECQRDARNGLLDTDETILDYIARDNELDFEKNLIKESTYARRKSTEKIIKESFLATIPISQITNRHLEKFFSEITSFSNSVIKKIYQALNKAFNQAVWDKVIDRNPLDKAGGIKIPKSKKPDKKVMALTIPEEKQVIEALTKIVQAYNVQRTPYKNCYAHQLLIEIFTGMRSGEINALALEDIDLENHRINVKYTVARGKNYQTYIGPTKTKAGTRTVLLDDNATKVIKQYLETVYSKKKKYQVTTSDGHKRTLLFSAYNHSTQQYDYITSSQCNDAFKRLCKKINVCGGNASAHMLRHTFATRCIEAGMPAHILQKLLGHTDISITMNTYCDVFDEQKSQGLSQAQEYLKANAVGIDFNTI